jgi:manganese transport protein
VHGTSYLYLAVGIIGATVMPHAIYLHSALTNGRMPARNDKERRVVLGYERIDVIIALGLAGVINMTMLAVAAKLFHTPALHDLSTIQQAHAEFGRLVGGGPRSPSRSRSSLRAPRPRASAPTPGRS